MKGPSILPHWVRIYKWLKQNFSIGIHGDPIDWENHK